MRKSFHYPAAALLAVVSHVLAIAFKVSPLLSGRLVDGDCYVRLARVEALLSGQGWYDTTLTLLNPPWGEAVHWTRPLDVLIAIAALPLLPVLGLHDAVWQAGLWISPLLELGAVALLLWGLEPHLKPRNLLLAGALFVFQPSIMGAFMAARPDHHGLLVLLEVAILAGLIRGGVRAVIFAGIASALALWVSVESLLFILASGLALGLSWVASGNDTCRKRLIFYTLALALGTALALIVERPPKEWLAIEYDRLSLVQAGLGGILLFSVSWLAIGNAWAVTWPSRLLLCLGMALQAGALLSILFPQFFAGPYSVIDPRLHEVWFNNIKEEQPLHFGQKFFVILFPPLMGLAYALFRQLRRIEAGERHLLLISLAFLLVLVPASKHLVRFAYFAQAADVVPWTLMILAAMRLRLWRVVLVPMLLTGHLQLAVLVTKLEIGARDPGTPNICAWDELAQHLRKSWPGDHRPILTYIFPGPELGYLSGHPVVAGPYHRSTEGILDIVNGLGGMDDETAKGIALRRKLGWVAVCDRESEGIGFDEKNGPDGFHAMLVRGDAPAWLKSAGAFASSKGNFRIYEVAD